MHHERWSGARVAAALAMLAGAGYPQGRLARMAGVNRSAVNRWARGENRPGHDAIRRLAAAVYREYPDVARELVEASGYGWSEPKAGEAPLTVIDRDFGEKAAEFRKIMRDAYGAGAPRMIRLVEEVLSQLPGDDDAQGERGARPAPR